MVFSPVARTSAASRPRNRSPSPAHLEPGTVLEWKGPSLAPTILPDLDSRTEHARRNTLHSALLQHATNPDSSSRRSFWIELVANLRHDGGRHLSQVWRCKAYRTGDNQQYPVVLKLYVDSLRPRVEHDPMGFVNPQQVAHNNGWLSTRELVRSEEIAYETLKRLQGVTIPYCYGRQTFTLSNGAQCPGFVLEDLALHTSSVKTLLEHDRHSSQPLNFEQFGNLMAAIMEMQDTLLDHSISIVHKSLSDILVVQTPSTGKRFEVATLGFGHSQQQHVVEEQLAETNKRNVKKGKPLKEWQDSAKDALVGLLTNELGESGLWKQWKQAHSGHNLN